MPIELFIQDLIQKMAQTMAMTLLTAMYRNPIAINPIADIPPNEYLSCFQQACHEVCINEPPYKRARTNSPRFLRFVRPTSYSGTYSDRPRDMFLINTDRIIQISVPHIYLEKFIKMYAAFIQTLSKTNNAVNWPNDPESAKALVESILVFEIIDYDKLSRVVKFNMYLLSMEDIKAQLEPSLQ